MANSSFNIGDTNKAIDTLSDQITTLNSNKVTLGTLIHNATTQASLESEFISIAQSMSDEEVRMGYCYPNFAAFGGVASWYIITRRSNGAYMVSLSNSSLFINGYYYSNSWHWYKATLTEM